MTTTAALAAPTPLVITAPVAEATVLEDRAHVVRTARVTLPAGRSRLSITGVAPVLADKTAIATLAGPAPVAINRLAVTRERLVLDADRSAAEAEHSARFRALKEEAAVLKERQQRADLARDKTVAAITATITEANDDAAWGRDGREDWRAALDTLHGREQAIIRDLVAIDAEIKDLRQRAHDQVEHGHHSVARPQMIAAITIDVEVTVPGDYALRLAYLVPNACWRPYHTARLLTPVAAPAATTGASYAQTSAATQLAFATDACIWQNTGEDWTGIRLRVSTARPSLGTAPPTLSNDRLFLRKKEAHIQVEIREQTMQNTGGAVDHSEAGGGNADDGLLGIDDGGEPQLLTCPGLATIPSDGLPHRAPLSAFTAPAESHLIVMGEITPAAILRTTQTNRSTRPLLAGPVDLIRGGGISGRAEILYVAPGAGFDLGWGPAGDLRIAREVEETLEKNPLTSLFTGWTSTLIRADIRISNLADGPRTITVHERIPVSSLDQVRVETGDITPPASPDADGFLRWTLTLPARSHREIVVNFRIRKHPDVVGM
jgi:uncharacterized protein (TIGR02231 family)